MTATTLQTKSQKHDLLPKGKQVDLTKISSPGRWKPEFAVPFNQRKLGKKILAGEYTLSTLADHAVESGLDPKPRSGKQELYENIIASHCRF